MQPASGWRTRYKSDLNMHILSRPGPRGILLCGLTPLDQRCITVQPWSEASIVRACHCWEGRRWQDQVGRSVQGRSGMC